MATPRNEYEIKRADAKKMYLGGDSVERIASKMGVTKSTVYKWRADDKWDNTVKLHKSLEGTLLEKNQIVYEWQLNAMLKRIERAKKENNYEMLLDNVDINSLVRQWESLTKGKINYETVNIVINRLTEYMLAHHAKQAGGMADVFDEFLAECRRTL